MSYVRQMFETVHSCKCWYASRRVLVHTAVVYCAYIDAKYTVCRLLLHAFWSTDSEGNAFSDNQLRWNVIKWLKLGTSYWCVTRTLIRYIYAHFFFCCGSFIFICIYINVNTKQVFNERNSANRPLQWNYKHLYYQYIKVNLTS